MMAKSKKAMTKSALYAHLAEKADLKKTQISMVMDEFISVATTELKKTGLFTVPGLARLKLAKVKAQKGGVKKINPITKQEYITKDKPAYNKVRVRPVKAFSESLK
jgi:nucleoid DNA-binding protein